MDKRRGPVTKPGSVVYSKRSERRTGPAEETGKEQQVKKMSKKPWERSVTRGVP